VDSPSARCLADRALLLGGNLRGCDAGLPRHGYRYCKTIQRPRKPSSSSPHRHQGPQRTVHGRRVCGARRCAVYRSLGTGGIADHMRGDWLLPYELYLRTTCFSSQLAGDSCAGCAGPRAPRSCCPEGRARKSRPRSGRQNPRTRSLQTHPGSGDTANLGRSTKPIRSAQKQLGLGSVSSFWASRGLAKCCAPGFMPVSRR